MRNVYSCENIPAHTFADQTVLFSLLRVLVIGARFLLFLSVMQCMHFVLPFFCILGKMGLLSLCLRLTAIPILNHSERFIFPALSNLLGEEYQLFQKCAAALGSCFFIFIFFKFFFGSDINVLAIHLF